MIDKSIIDCIKNLDKSLNISGLITFMNQTKIIFQDKSLKGPIGVTTIYGILLDIHTLKKYFSDKIIFFVILHEIGHFKRITKFGNAHIISMLSLEEFEQFFEHVIGEELIADRYGTYLFWVLNKEIYPNNLTQQLNLIENIIQYRRPIKNLFGLVKNSEENYKELIKTLIHD